MKVTYIELAGEKHPLCFSLSAVEELSDKFGDLDKMAAAITDGKNSVKKLKAVDTVLRVLLDAGRRYCAAAGIEMPEKPLGCRPADVIDITDPSAVEAIFTTLKNDTERTLEAKPLKNAEPTPEE